MFVKGSSKSYSILPWTFNILRSCPETSIAIVVSPLTERPGYFSDCQGNPGDMRRRNHRRTIKDDTVDKIHEGEFQLLWKDMLQSPHYRKKVAFEAHCIGARYTCKALIATIFR